MVNAINSATASNAATTVQTSSASSVSTFSLSSGSDTLEDIFQRAADTYGVDVNLLKAVAKAESNFNPNAVSSAGAQGIMQLMPATAAGLGVTDPFDPEQNIMAGAKYLSQMLDRYDGDVSLALAAYNAGPGNVDKYGGIPPFTETQNYVAKVMSYYTGEEITVPDITYSSTSGSSSITSSEINAILGIEDKSESSTLDACMEAMKEQMVLSMIQMQMNKSDDDDEHNKLSFL